MPDETIHVSVTPEEKRKIRAESGKRDQSMSELGRNAIIDWLDDETAAES